MPFTRFGLHFASTSYADIETPVLFERIIDVARTAERCGFDSLWVPDHAVQNGVGGGPTSPMLDAYVLLSAIAASTDQAKLGALVSPVTFRSPALLAKTVTSLDVISKGRAILGIGAAWDTDEHSTYGIDFPPVGEREDRLEEAVQICRAMFLEEAPSFAGRYYTIDRAFNFPRPVQSSIPILVGGGGEKRTLQIAARFADACNVFGNAEAIRHKFDVLEHHCEAIGRDPKEIEKTCSLFPPEDVDELCVAVHDRLDAGADGVLLLARDCPTAEIVEKWGTTLSSEFHAA